MRVTDEELEKIREQQSTIAKIKQDLGTLELRKHELMQVFIGVNKDVEETKAELEEKYGLVNIDLSDGSYSKIEEEPTK
jgi:vacuolar-type H+-ATPase subunit D/Vma8